MKKYIVKAFCNRGPSKSMIENGIKTTTPNNGWVEIKTFDDFCEAEDWMTAYINDNGYHYGDFRIVTKEA